MPRMQELLDQCRELCEEFDSHPYALASSPSGHGGPVSQLTDKVGGVTDTVGGATDSVRGMTDNLLGEARRSGARRNERTRFVLEGKRERGPGWYQPGPSLCPYAP